MAGEGMVLDMVLLDALETGRVGASHGVVWISVAWRAAAMVMFFGLLYMCLELDCLDGVDL